MLNIDNIQDALLYESEWWFMPHGTMESIDNVSEIAKLTVEYGYGEDLYLDNDGLSFVCLFIREAIKE